MPDSKHRLDPDLIFRLLGYGGLGVVAAVNLAADPAPGFGLLLAFTLVWPSCWWWLTRKKSSLRSSAEGASQFSHAAECLLIMGFVMVSGLELWFLIAVGLLILTGVTALGGLRLFAPCALIVALVLLVQTQGNAVQGEALNPAAVASGIMVASFLIGLAFLSFSRVTRLDGHRRRALSETAALRHRNARLIRYLPDDLEDLIGEGEGGVNRPRDCFATVAFVDVVGFVELVASRPMAELVDVVNDFISAVTVLTERHGGIVSKFLGDGVLIYFPDYLPDDSSPDNYGRTADGRSLTAARCARLCLELSPALAGLGEDWRRRGLSINLSIRAGVASGYCAIGDWGGGDRLDYTLIGTPVNLAARLQAQADPGGVLVTDTTAALLCARGSFENCLFGGRMVSIKGFGSCMVHELTASAKVRANSLPDSAISHDGKGISQSLQR